MKECAYFCDLCVVEYDLRLAIARYWNEQDEEWHACKKHLALVKEAKLDYEEFPTPGNI